MSNDIKRKSLNTNANLQPVKSGEVMRRQHNEDLLRRMRSGEALWSFDSNASWFPERPKIKKDPKALARLYRTAEENSASETLLATSDVGQISRSASTSSKDESQAE